MRMDDHFLDILRGDLEIWNHELWQITMDTD
jgi:hypothetical protein